MQYLKYITTSVIVSLSMSLPAHSSVSPGGLWSDTLSRSLIDKEFNYRSVNASAEELVNQLKRPP